MPLYPYRCTQCGHRFEKIQHFNDEPEKICPECGGELERILTAPGLSFKGAGWYVNDYAAKGGSSSSDSGSKTESKPDAKADSKPESKSESKSEMKASAAESSSAAPAPSAPAASTKPKTGS